MTMHDPIDIPFADMFTLGGVFLFYAVMCALGIAFVAFIMPETKGKSLEEISAELSSK